MNNELSNQRQEKYISESEFIEVKKSYENSIEKLEQKISDFEKEIEQKNNRISELNEIITNKDSIIKDMKDAHEKQIKDIKADGTNKANKEYLDKYNAAIDDKERLNNKLECVIEDAEKELKDLNKNNRELEKQVLYYVNQYNKLFNDVQNISFISFLNGKVKSIKNDYQEIKIIDNPNVYTIPTNNNESGSTTDKDID